MYRSAEWEEAKDKKTGRHGEAVMIHSSPYLHISLSPHLFSYL
jgi:hypothetical protein